MFCLMVGTAGLPHLLTRYYTAPTVAGARASVAWTLFFIALLYLSAPALAALVKYEVMHNLVGSRFDQLPNWMAQWARVDAALLSVEDVNRDGIVQFGEIRLGPTSSCWLCRDWRFAVCDFGLVAAGGLAAALSTADGLLLTISNALVRDLYFQDQSKPRPTSAEQRVILSKFALLAVALSAAFVAALKPSDILPLVSASFSIAASAFVPAMVLGIFWRGTTRQGAVAGMVCVRLAVTLYWTASRRVFGGLCAFCCPMACGGRWFVAGYSAHFCRRVWRAGGCAGHLAGELADTPWPTPATGALGDVAPGAHLCSPGWALNSQQFDVKLQRGVGRNHATRAACAIAQLGRNDECALAAHLHTLHAFIPARMTMPAPRRKTKGSLRSRLESNLGALLAVLVQPAGVMPHARWRLPVRWRRCQPRCLRIAGRRRWW